MPYSLRPHFVPSTILRLLQLFSQLTRLTLQLDSICANAILKILASGITVASAPLRSMIENRSTPSPSSKSMASIVPLLRSLRLYLIGVRNLVVEVDARYIKGMLANPDISPSASINRWIVSILTFHFNLVHVAGSHHAPDGLS